MSPHDASFSPHPDLNRAVDWLQQPLPDPEALPSTFPETGLGELATLEALAPHVLGEAARLDAPGVLAHMDPPTPWITWAMALWNARLNQNILHLSTAPFATAAEDRVISWLTPFFGMGGGHFCSGSTLANLTALWAARDAAGARRVIASEGSHISIPKAAVILGIPFEKIPVTAHEQIDVEQLGDLSDACLVLNAGTTATGAIDPLNLAGQAAWTHVDAAWGGPLRLSPQYAHLLDGIAAADSITLSAHKWLFQPKESALILFQDPERVEPAISFGGSYLAKPNTGVQGSRGAAAIPLLATCLAWGRTGLVDRINRTMAIAESLAAGVETDPHFELWGQPQTGITVFRPTHQPVDSFYAELPPDMLSTCLVQHVKWLRSVAANPVANVEEILSTLYAVGHRA